MAINEMTDIKLCLIEDKEGSDEGSTIHSLPQDAFRIIRLLRSKYQLRNIFGDIPPTILLQLNSLN